MSRRVSSWWFVSLVEKHSDIFGTVGFFGWEIDRLILLLVANVLCVLRFMINDL